MEKYDPMVDFYKRAIDFLFKQGIAAVLCIVAVFVLWNEMNRRDNVNEAKISLLNTRWSESLNDAREDWRACEEKRRELEIQFTELKARVDILSRRR
jgi:hypothetical protein